uniref:Uncharacterized protein n=1 Tax=Cucumis melo TaxID=3656 RepID=A0A9I9D1D6_CUCME
MDVQEEEKRAMENLEEESKIQRGLAPRSARHIDVGGNLDVSRRDQSSRRDLATRPRI